MAQVFGIEAQAAPSASAEPQPPVRYVVLIDSAAAGGRVARLLLETYEQVAEFAAAAPEVQLMVRDLAARRGAAAAQWDVALGGHSRSEREGAEIYTLDL